MARNEKAEAEMKKTDTAVVKAQKDVMKKRTAKKADAKSVVEKKAKKNDKTFLAKEPRTINRRRPELKVLFVAAEAEPFISTGGLGQVVGALPKALRDAMPEIDVRVVIPLYSEVEARFSSMLTYMGMKYVPLSWRNQYCGLFQTQVEGVTYYFIDNKQYFDRERCYGYFDDGERFAYFSKAVLEALEMMDFQPDIIHANDWQSALVPVYMKSRYAGRFVNTRSVFTIHNLEYQGKYDISICDDVFDLHDWEQGLVEYDGCVNLMKGAIVCCDRLTTVSPTYASEVQGDAGFGLQGIIRSNSGKFTGILNGIDVKSYNPATDPVLGKNYDVLQLENKYINKTELQKIFNLDCDPQKPLVAMITRLVTHKGIDLVTYVLEEMLSKDIQFVLLGTGKHEYELFFEEMALRYSGRMGVSISFNPNVSRKIYAGADMFLMPSLNEPCGLAQMIACRYGAVPIVRATGGLRDSIRDCRGGDGNGFVFNNYDAYDMLSTVHEAINLYCEHPDDWKNLMVDSMNTDFSWEASARQYCAMYEQIRP